MKTQRAGAGRAAQSASSPRRRRIAYETSLGKAYWANGLDVLRGLSPNSVQLVLTSPPFPLMRKKAYGNEVGDAYLRWLRPFLVEVHRVLRKDGSLVIDLGGTWTPGKPVRSVYQFEVLLSLLKQKPSYYLAQEFYWLNRAKLPSPVQWVNVERTRLTDAVNVVWWLSKTERPYADNRNVLRAYSASMLKLFKDGYNSGWRPSEWTIGSNSFSSNNGGSIPNNFISSDNEAEPNFGYPTNLLAGANTGSRDPYLEVCRSLGIKSHPARFPLRFADFFVRFLTQPKHLVVDPFAGSNTSGQAAEALGRRWISAELDREYAAASAARFGIDPAAVLRKLGQANFGKAPARAKRASAQTAVQAIGSAS